MGWNLLYILDNIYTLIPSHTGSRARQVELVAVNGYILAQYLSVRLYSSLKNQVGCFNYGVVILVAAKRMRQRL